MVLMAVGWWAKSSITVTPEGAGTRVDWRQEFESDDLFRRLAEFVRPSNEQNLDRLAALLA